jgi:hypothetical protein
MARETVSLARAMVIAAVIVGASGCQEETPLAPSPGAMAPPLTAESFIGTIGAGGTAFYSFNVPVEGPVSFTLLQYREDGQDTTKVAMMGLGVPAGTTCIVASSVTTAAGGRPQFTQVVPPSIYCVRITDPGQLEGTGEFLINIVRPK